LGQIREITKGKNKTAEVEKGRHHFTKEPLVAKRPNGLVERLELSMASKHAGNTWIRNEIVSISDELLRLKVTSHDIYKP